MSVFIGYPSFMAYQMMKGKKGNNDGFPQLPGDVTRWHFGGLTNEMMAAMDDPRIEDVDGKGRFLSFKNFAWKGMSGVGGYVTNKDVYEYDLDHYSHPFIEYGTKVRDFYIVFELTGYDENFKDGFNLDVRSISQGLKKRETYTKNGIYIFQYKDEEGLDNLYAIGYNGNGGARSNFTVKILPLYPGALVFDGVDDYGVCENFPILTKEKGYTVVALRQWLSFQDDGYFSLVANSKERGGSFNFEDFRNARKTTWSWGTTNVINFNTRMPYTYQTSTLYSGKAISAGTTEKGGNVLQVCRSGIYCANAAIWEIVILDHDATEEELTKIKDYFVKIYPWLFFDQAWTVAGKTNEDADRDTIANITGNGNDLVLQNFGFIEGSGYNEEGEYAGYLVTDGVDDKIVSSQNFNLGTSFTIVGDWEFLPIDKLNYTGMHKANNLVLYNNVTGLKLFIHQLQMVIDLDVKRLNAICSDGRVYDKDWNEIMVYVPEVGITSAGKLMISSNNVDRFTTMVFKNLGIYNNQILSKEDCIKAYNYLQTLKAK